MIRYRQLDPDGDYVMGRGPGEFYVDSPEAVVQAVRTRLRLVEGEWFLDQAEGTPWFSKVLGENTIALFDQAIQERIIGTLGVAAITEYGSAIDLNTRRLRVVAVVSTVPFPGVVAPTPGRLDIDFVLGESILG